jgi:hypothetical protein
MHSTRTLIERESRVPQIQGVQGRSRPAGAGLRAIGNVDAAGVKPKAMGYHRLSRPVGSSCPVVARRAKSEAESEAQRVNKMEWLFGNLYFTDVIFVNNLHIA